MTSWSGNIFRVTGHFMRGIHRSPHKGQWRGALMFSFVCAWNDWVNNGGAGDLRRRRARCDVTAMRFQVVLILAIKWYCSVLRPGTVSYARLLLESGFGMLMKCSDSDCCNHGYAMSVFLVDSASVKQDSTIIWIVFCFSISNRSCTAQCSVSIR